jgi:hypothetical protein
METSADRFYIPNADELYCSVWQYRPWHSFLKIRVYEENLKTLFWLNFYTPVYFRCPMSWRGANFRIATAEEFSEFASDGFLRSDIARQYQLFIAEVDHDLPHPNIVQILATHAESWAEE